MNVYEQLHDIRIIPVIKINDSKRAVILAKTLLEARLPAAEITFRTDAAEDAIRQISRNVPEVCVCAGTILSVDSAKRAVNAGAKAIISPGTNHDVVRWCLDNGVTVIPGCATPSEIENCMRLGLDVVKLFPAEVVGGVKMLKALSGPYPKIKFMSTGGITEKNVDEYLELSNVLCCGGSWIVPEKALDDGDFDTILSIACRCGNKITKKIIINKTK